MQNDTDKANFRCTSDKKILFELSSSKVFQIDFQIAQFDSIFLDLNRTVWTLNRKAFELASSIQFIFGTIEQFKNILNRLLNCPVQFRFFSIYTVYSLKVESAGFWTS